jgi:hypothetical protein
LEWAKQIYWIIIYVKIVRNNHNQRKSSHQQMTAKKQNWQIIMHITLTQQQLTNKRKKLQMECIINVWCVKRKSMDSPLRCMIWSSVMNVWKIPKLHSKQWDHKKNHLTNNLIKTKQIRKAKIKKFGVHCNPINNQSKLCEEKRMNKFYKKPK